MGSPNIPNGLQVHAAGSINGGAPSVGSGSVNISGISGGAGAWTINLGSPIAPNSRVVILSLKTISRVISEGFIEVPFGSDLSTIVGVRIQDLAGQNADGNFDILVLRRSIGS